MSTWKQLTAAVDTSAKKFLQNKRFTRERKKFTWDWHAWNLVLVSTPALVLWGFLHRLDKRVVEEERLREEIQERTGVGSRGYLMPSKKLREEARDMLRHKHQHSEKPSEIKNLRGAAGVSTELGPTEGKTGGVGQKNLEEERKTLEHFLSQQRALQLRVDAIEQELGVEGASNSAETRQEDDSRKSEASYIVDDKRDKNNDTGGESSSSVDTVRGAAHKATEVASAAGEWVVTIGISQGKRFYRATRDWLADENTVGISRDPGGAKGEQRENASSEATAHFVERERGKKQSSTKRETEDGSLASKGRDSVSSEDRHGGGSDRQSGRR